MTTICNWNLHHLFPKILKIRGYDGQISHGICGQCAAQILKNLEQKTEKKEIKEEISITPMSVNWENTEISFLLRD